MQELFRHINAGSQSAMVMFSGYDERIMEEELELEDVFDLSLYGSGKGIGELMKR